MASWFYLTLWNGSPDEFTSKFDVAIAGRKEKNADVFMSHSSPSKVRIKSPIHVSIEKRHDSDAGIHTRTGVKWHVRGQH